MKYDPFDSILSSKAKKNKRDADIKPYFENTIDTLGLYKNPSLKSEEEEDEDDEKSRPKGMALLKKIYGAGAGASIPVADEQKIIYKKQSFIPDFGIEVPENVRLFYQADKNGRLDALEWDRRFKGLNTEEKKLYRELKNLDLKKELAAKKGLKGKGKPCWKGYEQFGMKEKNGKQVPNCIPKGGGQVASFLTSPNFTEAAETATSQQQIDNIYRDIRRWSIGQGLRVQDPAVQLIRRGMIVAIQENNLNANRQGLNRFQPRNLTWEALDRVPPTPKPFQPPNPPRPRGAGTAASVERPRPVRQPSVFLSPSKANRALNGFYSAIYGNKKRVFTEQQKQEILPVIEVFRTYPTPNLRDFIKSKFTEYINEEIKSRGERKLMTGEDLNIGEEDDIYSLPSEPSSSDEEERQPVTTAGRGRRKKGAGVIPCGTSCKKKVRDTYNRVVDNYSDVVNHLEEHLQEKAGDPLDAKQSKYLKSEIKRINELHLTPALKVRGNDPLYQVSNPREVQRKALQLYGKDAIVYKSDKPNKKYQILNKNTGKWVYFGDAKMEDFTRHQDLQRRKNYLARALGIKGKWRNNPYSPNTLAIFLLW